MEFPDLIWTILGILLTLMIFSYVWGDNPLFRTASYLFVGVTAGYVAVLLITQVILPRLAWPLLRTSTPTEITIAAVGVVLALLLLTKLVRPLAGWATCPWPDRRRCGGRHRLGGSGRHHPQTLDGITAFAPGGQLIDGLFMLIGTIATWPISTSAPATEWRTRPGSWSRSFPGRQGLRSITLGAVRRNGRLADRPDRAGGFSGYFTDAVLADRCL